MISITGFNKALAIVCVVIMTATAFQVASAKAVNHDQWDFVVDQNGWTHGVYVAPYFTGPNQPMNDEIFYVDNVGGHWSEPIGISNSPEKSSYPQIDIDSQLGIIYVTWLEDGPQNRPIWYAGSIDGVEWSASRPSGEIVGHPGNVHIEMAAEGGVLELTWKQGGYAVIVADLDRDMIPDYKDVRPLDFDIYIGSPFNADAVTIDLNLGVCVAIDYASNILVKPIISISTAQQVNGSVGTGVAITTSTNESFSAIIKIKYDPSTINQSITERYLRMYWQNGASWLIMLNKTTNENTSIDLANDYVWAATTHFTNFTIIDSSYMDSDNDTLSDAKEINMDNRPPTSQITTFKDGCSSATIDCLKDQTYKVDIDIPVSLVATTVITNATFTMTNDFRMFNEKQVTIDSNSGVHYNYPSIFGDKIVYSSNKDGNEDIYLFNLTSSEEIQISTSTTLNTGPKIWGDNVVWLSQTGGGSYCVLLYNISTGNISTVAVGCYAPDIGGNYIVWGPVWETGVRLYNTSTSTITTVSVNSCGTPHVYGDFVAYNDYLIGGLILYQISSGLIQQINAPGSNPFLIDIGESYVVYQDLNTNDLYAYNIIQNTTIRITNTPSLVENQPTIFSNIVAWTDYRNGNADIYGYNLDNNIMFPVCRNIGDQTGAAVYLDKVVWQDARNGDSRIFMATPTNSTVDFFINGDNVPFWNARASSENHYSPDFSANLNKYYMSHSDIDDGLLDNYISIPISLISNLNGTVDISQFNIDLSNYQTNPLSLDTDKDGLSDDYEILTITNPNEPTTYPILPYRLITVYSDHFDTLIKYPTTTERSQTGDGIDISNVYGSNAILEPSTGHPQFVIKSNPILLYFVICSGTITEVKVRSSTGSTQYTFQPTAVTTDYIGPDVIGRTIKKCHITLSSAIPEGTYDLYVSISGIPTSWAPHSIAVRNAYKSTFNFIQVSDIHIGETTVGSNVGDFWAIIKAINRENPEFVIITGDFTEHGYLNEYKYFKACLYQCHVPVFLSPGNHDWKNNGITIYDSYLTPRTSGAAPYYRDYAFKYGSYGFIQFDSMVMDMQYWTYRLTGLSNNQLTWIKTMYTSLFSAGCTRQFIFSHAEIVGRNDYYTHTQNDGNFVDWVNGYNDGIPKVVEAYFCGHTHENKKFYEVYYNNGNSNGINNPPVIASQSLLYQYKTYYIETTTATEWM